MAETTACSQCGAEILSRTAAKTGGKCMPCDQGRRTDIEASKLRAAHERERERVNEGALARIQSAKNPAFGDFLAEGDPVGVLWPYLVNTVFARANEENVANVTPRAAALYYFGVLDAEIINGGFDQYFSNSSGDHAHEALAALLEIGAVEKAKLLQQAIHAFPRHRVPKDWDERNEVLEEIDSKVFDALDTKYYELVDAETEDLGELMVAFMKRHPQQRIVP